MRFFRGKAELRQMDAYRAHLHALGELTRPSPPLPAVGPAGETELAPVVSLAYLRARRAGHPSAGSPAPVQPAASRRH